MNPIELIPKPKERQTGLHDVIIAWFPGPLPFLEEIALAKRGAMPKKIGRVYGFLIEDSLCSLPNEAAELLKQDAFARIKQNPKEVYLGIWGRYHYGE